jgi:selenocysteine-specific elongation factor
VHMGTDQVEAHVTPVGSTWASQTTPLVAALLHLARPVAAATGDRLVLRRPHPAGLLGGGVVLDPGPPRGASRRRLTTELVGRLAAAVASGDATGVDVALLDLHGVRHGTGRARVAPDVEATVTTAVHAAVAAHHVGAPQEPGMPMAALRATGWRAARRLASVPWAASAAVVDAIVGSEVAAGRLVREADRVRDPGHRPAGPSAALAAAMDRLEAALDTPSPPALSAAAREAGCPAEGVRELERAGRIVVLDDDLAWSRRAHAELAATATSLAARGPLTPAALRDATGTSRKYVMALLADLDRRGVLRRTPEGHVPGPRAGARLDASDAVVGVDGEEGGRRDRADG